LFAVGLLILVLFGCMLLSVILLLVCEVCGLSLSPLIL
jgi:hypothetical protein